MKKYMEDSLAGSKASITIPKRFEHTFKSPNQIRPERLEKDKSREDALEKYTSPAFVKKLATGPSDQQDLHKKLRAILSRKNILKTPPQHFSQVDLEENPRD